MDECGISVVHKPGKVVTVLGRRNVWAITSAEKGKMHTVLCCVSCSGQALPPFMIFPRKRMLENSKWDVCQEHIFLVVLVGGSLMTFT